MSSISLTKTDNGNNKFTDICRMCKTFIKIYCNHAKISANYFTYTVVMRVRANHRLRVKYEIIRVVPNDVWNGHVHHLDYDYGAIGTCAHFRRYVMRLVTSVLQCKTASVRLVRRINEVPRSKRKRRFVFVRTTMMSLNEALALFERNGHCLASGSIRRSTLDGNSNEQIIITITIIIIFHMYCNVCILRSNRYCCCHRCRYPPYLNNVYLLPEVTDGPVSLCKNFCAGTEWWAFLLLCYACQQNYTTTTTINVRTYTETVAVKIQTTTLTNTFAHEHAFGCWPVSNGTCCRDVDDAASVYATEEHCYRRYRQWRKARNKLATDTENNDIIRAATESYRTRCSHQNQNLSKLSTCAKRESCLCSRFCSQLSRVSVSSSGSRNRNSNTNTNSNNNDCRGNVGQARANIPSIIRAKASNTKVEAKLNTTKTDNSVYTGKAMRLTIEVSQASTSANNLSTSVNGQALRDGLWHASCRTMCINAVPGGACVPPGCLANKCITHAKCLNALGHTEFDDDITKNMRQLHVSVDQLQQPPPQLLRDIRRRHHHKGGCVIVAKVDELKEYISHDDDNINKNNEANGRIKTPSPPQHFSSSYHYCCLNDVTRTKPNYPYVVHYIVHLQSPVSHRHHRRWQQQRATTQIKVCTWSMRYHKHIACSASLMCTHNDYIMCLEIYGYHLLTNNVSSLSSTALHPPTILVMPCSLVLVVLSMHDKINSTKKCRRCVKVSSPFDVPQKSPYTFAPLNVGLLTIGADECAINKMTIEQYYSARQVTVYQEAKKEIRDSLRILPCSVTSIELYENICILTRWDASEVYIQSTSATQLPYLSIQSSSSRQSASAIVCYNKEPHTLADYSQMDVSEGGDVPSLLLTADSELPDIQTMPIQVEKMLSPKRPKIKCLKIVALSRYQIIACSLTIVWVLLSGCGQRNICVQAKGVAGLGKAGGDSQGGSDKAGQQVPPEVYNALFWAGLAFLTTLAMPLVLYGLNKLLNVIEECFGCRRNGERHNGTNRSSSAPSGQLAPGGAHQQRARHENFANDKQHQQKKDGSQRAANLRDQLELNGGTVNSKTAGTPYQSWQEHQHQYYPHHHHRHEPNHHTYHPRGRAGSTTKGTTKHSTHSQALISSTSGNNNHDSNKIANNKTTNKLEHQQTIGKYGRSESQTSSLDCESRWPIQSTELVHNSGCDNNQIQLRAVSASNDDAQCHNASVNHNRNGSSTIDTISATMNPATTIANGRTLIDTTFDGVDNDNEAMAKEVLLSRSTHQHRNSSVNVPNFTRTTLASIGSLAHSTSSALSISDSTNTSSYSQCMASLPTSSLSSDSTAPVALLSAPYRRYNENQQQQHQQQTIKHSPSVMNHAVKCRPSSTGCQRSLTEWCYTTCATGHGHDLLTLDVPSLNQCITSLYGVP